MSVNESLTVFVDTFFGDDNTGRLESLNFKFQTFTAAYNTIEGLGPDRPPYTISLSSGVYLLDLNAYKNINIITTNGIDSLNPVIVVPEIEISFNGVSVADSDVFFIQNTGKSFRPSLKIIGASEFTQTSNIILQNFDIQGNIDILSLCDQFDDIRVKSNENKKEINEPKQIDPNKVNYLIINESEFECRGNVFIEPLIFLGHDDQAVGYINSILGDTVSVPPNMSGELIVGSIVRGGKTILFTNNESSSTISDYSDFVLAYIEDEEEPVRSMQAKFTDYSLLGVVMQIFDQSQTLTTGRYVEKLFRSSSLVNEKNIVAPNPISEAIKESVLTQIENAQNAAGNRLSSSDDILPTIAFIDCNITTRNEKILTNNIIDYMVDGSNTSGVILPDNPDIMSEVSMYPIINTSEREGANINRGSQFVRYRCIESSRDNKTVYVHNRLDGEIFLIDASKGPVKVIIPKEICNDGLCWKGRVITYKRTDNTCNKVKIINKRGKIDNTTCAVELKSSKCEWKLPVLKIIISENGNAFIL